MEWIAARNSENEGGSSLGISPFAPPAIVMKRLSHAHGGFCKGKPPASQIQLDFTTSCSHEALEVAAHRALRPARRPRPASRASRLRALRAPRAVRLAAAPRAPRAPCARNVAPHAEILLATHPHGARTHPALARPKLGTPHVISEMTCNVKTPDGAGLPHLFHSSVLKRNVHQIILAFPPQFATINKVVQNSALCHVWARGGHSETRRTASSARARREAQRRSRDCRGGAQRDKGKDANNLKNRAIMLRIRRDKQSMASFTM